METFKGAIVQDNPVPSSKYIKSPDEAKPFVKSFDTSTALAGMYLWLLFGFFSSLLGCDLQRAVTGNMYIKHLVALITFFFLMTVIDTDNEAGIVETWIKTFVVYILFLMSTKSKLIASITVLLILIVDQTLKIHMQQVLKRNPTEDLSTIQKVRDNLFKILVAVIIIGYIHYFIRARSEYGNNFSYSKFVFGTVQCSNNK